MNFFSTAISGAVSDYALSRLAYFAVLTAMAACPTVVQIGKRVTDDAVTHGVSKTTPASAGLPIRTCMTMFTAILSVVRLAIVLPRIILGQVILSLACIGDTFPLLAGTSIPPWIFITIFGLAATGGFRIFYTDFIENVIVFFAGGDKACGAAAYHGLCILRHFCIAVMSAFAAVRCADVRIGTFPVAIRFGVLAFVAAFSA